ncbi:MAG TPA: menaquinone biosynthesis decarboxylase, partial [Acidobacteriaceae bacterium]|nr:menaquinone biosynthesis decarboxylase [Acidobacteriaceae bacterium]
MASNDLREWIDVLEKSGEIKHIKHEVSPLLEVAEITDRVSKAGYSGGVSGYAAGGPALLFENVQGYRGAKILMNQFGSERRMCLAL